MLVVYYLNPYNKVGEYIDIPRKMKITSEINQDELGFKTIKSNKSIVKNANIIFWEALRNEHA